MVIRAARAVRPAKLEKHSRGPTSRRPGPCSGRWDASEGRGHRRARRRRPGPSPDDPGRAAAARSRRGPSPPLMRSASVRQTVMSNRSRRARREGQRRPDTAAITIGTAERSLAMRAQLRVSLLSGERVVIARAGATHIAERTSVISMCAWRSRTAIEVLRCAGRAA